MSTLVPQQVQPLIDKATSSQQDSKVRHLLFYQAHIQLASARYIRRRQLPTLTKSPVELTTSEPDDEARVANFLAADTTWGTTDADFT